MSVQLPELIEIEPTLSCNLRCRMCHVSYMPNEPRAVFDADLIARLACLKGKYFTLGSAFEPMVHPRFNDIIRQLNQIEARIELITNGTLLEEESLKVLTDSGLETVT